MNNDMNKVNQLTTEVAAPVTNDQASLTTGKKVGYTVFADSYLNEKLAHFNRERIPERVVHAKGMGAHGYFEVTNDLSKYTMAKFLNKVGKRTPMFARFSTVGGEKGSADTARDPRGFALKFYTEDGNYDLVGNNTPVFFVRDAIKFPDFIHTQKRNPQTNLKDANMFWDFLSLTPESLHQVMRLFSNLGTPKSPRFMDGFGSHTFMWYNKDKEYVWVKYHFLTDQGIENFTGAEAEQMAGVNPDYSTQDLFDAIERGDYPSWSVYVQIMTPEEAKSYPVNPFDVTKTWYEKDHPLIPLGKMVLNRNPINFFEEVEQAAFCPQAFVPGIWTSPDKLLQGRLLAYQDAQRYRIGVNSRQIPINAPKYAKIYTTQRDGAMQVNGNMGNAPNYYPTTFADVQVSPEDAPPPIPVDGVIERHTIYTDEQDFIQPGEFYRDYLDQEGKAHLIHNVVNSLKNADKSLQYRQAALFYKCDEMLGELIAQFLDLNVNQVIKLANMSQEERVKNTMPKPLEFTTRSDVE
nr:catalase [uncultured Niameybacter sp.]